MSALFLPLLSPVAADMPTQTDTNLLELFLQADIVVKLVILGLVLASIWVWTIIIGFTLRMRSINRGTDKFEQNFRQAEDLDAFYEAHRTSKLPIARVLTAGIAEWRRSTAGRQIDRAGTRDRLSLTMNATIDSEVEELSSRLNFLATTASAAPFVGLFGTVWGIMRSFTAIAGAQNTSLDVVAPGIAEALFATAIGLFAAIPAVIAYNRLSHRLNRYEARLARFADGFHATMSRELENN